MGNKVTKSKATSGKMDLSRLSDEEFQSLLDLAETALADPEADEEVDDEEVEDDEVVDEAPRKTRRKKSRTKVTIDKESEDDGDEDEEDDESDESDETDLSDSDRVIKRGEVSQFQQMRLDLAEERWERERGDFLSAGVPAFLLDLAEPVLSLPDAMTIDLSDDETLDASDTIRQMLAGVKGVIDLTGEIGHQIDLADDEDDDTTTFLKAWDEQYG